ncbi:MAG: 7-carboxy-7-deazaguanine synthase QueE [Methanobacteriaceae archaeon]
MFNGKNTKNSTISADITHNINDNGIKAPVIEIFSSIQGEGTLVGRRQIFIRFAGCNLDCNYCDTSKSKNIDTGMVMSVEDVLNKINELATPDLHSISFTGGEPLIHAKFISNVIKNFDKFPYKSFLETNGTLPNQLKLLKNIDYVSLDIKLPEHFVSIDENNSNSDIFKDSEDFKEIFDFWENNIFKNELESIKILIEWNTNIYCKLVVSPKTKISEIEDIAKQISEIIIKEANVQRESITIPMVIQPISPIEQWYSNGNKYLEPKKQNDSSGEPKILEISKAVGKYMDVLTIPQLHKVLNIE